MKSAKAREMRIRYKIRKLILTGKIDIPVEDAKNLVGPDTAYRLYSNVKGRRQKEQPD